MKPQNMTDGANENETWSADRIKELTLSKIRDAAPQPARQAPRGFKKRFAIAAVAALLTLTATAFAMGHYLSSFDRLRDIVGDDRADELHPVEINNAEGHHITHTGFRVELVAVGLSANVIDLYLTLEDMESNRLDGEFRAGASVGHPGVPRSPSFTIMNILSRTDDGVVTLHMRHFATEGITSGQALAFTLNRLLYNFRLGELAIGFDLSSVEEHLPAAYLWDTPILTPHMHDINVALEGFECAGFNSISSIGIIGGRLHIQEEYDMVALNGWYHNRVRLIDPYGEIVEPLHGTFDSTASLSFGIDELGNFYNDRGFNFATFQYRENIFEVDLERLSEYQLVASFEANDRMVHPWTATFYVDVPDGDSESLIAEGLDVLIERYSTTITEVQITPYSILLSGVQGYHLDDPTTPYDANVAMFSLEPRINMADGTVIPVSLLGLNTFEFYSREIRELRYVETGSIDLSSVVSIEIDGKVIMFR